MGTKRAALMASLAWALLSGTAQASYIVNFSQTAAGVLATGSGEFDTTFLTDQGPQTDSGPGVSPENGIVVFGPSATDPFTGEVYSATIVPLESYGFGPGPGGNATTSSGDAAGFAVSFNDIVVPTDYTSGAELKSQMLFAGATFESLGLTPGQYAYFYAPVLPPAAIALVRNAEEFSALASPNTIVVNVGTVPLPASAPMFGAALIAFGAVGYGLKRKGKAAAEA